MNHSQKVSVVINNYNYGRFLNDSIDSALAQDWPELEVIVVDDGSTDDSHEIIHSYGGRVQAVLKENGGQASAFNAGFAASSGDVVIFLDADDMLAASAASAAVRAFGAGVSKVHWSLRIIDRNGNDTGDRFPKETPVDGDFRDVALINGPFYDTNNLPPTSGNAWSRWFLREAMPVPPAFDHGADVYLHTVAALYGSMRRVAGVQGVYRAHGSNHYWRSPLTDSKISEYLGRFNASCVALERHASKLRIRVCSQEWRERNFNYLWLTRLRLARTDLTENTTGADKIILIDGQEWGGPDALPGRRILPFIESSGDWAGPPSDDTQAIQELERMKAAGATHLALWWTCWWWRNAYPHLFEHLDRHSTRLIDNDRLLVFDMRRFSVRSEDVC